MQVIAPHLTADVAVGRSGLAAALRDRAWTIGLALLGLALNLELALGGDSIAQALQWRPGAPWWTLLTSHMVHLNWRHFLMDVGVLVALGLSVEPVARRRMLRTLLAGALAIGAWVVLVERMPYRGLSGLDNVLWGLAIMCALREGAFGRWRAGWLLLGVLFKIGWEFSTGSLLWCPTLLGDNGVVLPSVHLLGLLVGLLGGLGHAAAPDS